MKAFARSLIHLGAAVLVAACGADAERPGNATEDPDDWPPAQDCDDWFRQEGKAGQAVEDCDRVPAETYTVLVHPAQADADAKANRRCPNSCPARFDSWETNRSSCVNNTATLYVTGNYQCVSP